MIVDTYGSVADTAAHQIGGDRFPLFRRNGSTVRQPVDDVLDGFHLPATNKVDWRTEEDWLKASSSGWDIVRCLFC